MRQKSRTPMSKKTFRNISKASNWTEQLSLALGFWFGGWGFMLRCDPEGDNMRWFQGRLRKIFYIFVSEIAENIVGGFLTDAFNDQRRSTLCMIGSYFSGAKKLTADEFDFIGPGPGTNKCQSWAWHKWMPISCGLFINCCRVLKLGDFPKWIAIYDRKNELEASKWRNDYQQLKTRLEWRGLLFAMDQGCHFRIMWRSYLWSPIEGRHDNGNTVGPRRWWSPVASGKFQIEDMALGRRLESHTKSQDAIL